MTLRTRSSCLRVVFAAALILSACTVLPPESTPSATDAGAAPDAAGPAAAYCQEQGGQVVNRTPFYGTNGPRDAWLQLGQPVAFCEFEDAADGSRISIKLETLYSSLPTLAVLAYRQPLPVDAVASGNPATAYCAKLGGTAEWGGVSAAGGGWVNEDEPVSPSWHLRLPGSVHH